MSIQPASAQLWKPVGWNGLSFQIPSDWDPDRVEPCYLRFRDSLGPTLELKWAAAPAPSSADRILKRFLKARRHTRHDFNPVPLPEEWRTAPVIAGAESPPTAFSWRRGRGGGCGVIFQAAEPPVTCLVHFPDGTSPCPPSVSSRILTSLQITAPMPRKGPDDPEKGSRLRLWALYDFRAEIPDRFDLAAFRLSPGTCHLQFTASRQRLSLWRWSPASALLRRSSLDRFVQERFGPAPEGIQVPDIPTLPPADAQCCWRTGTQTRSVLKRLLQKRPSESREEGCAWLLSEKNRILAMTLAGASRDGSAALLQLCRHFTCTTCPNGTGLRNVCRTAEAT